MCSRLWGLGSGRGREAQGLVTGVGAAAIGQEQQRPGRPRAGAGLAVATYWASVPSSVRGAQASGTGGGPGPPSSPTGLVAAGGAHSGSRFLMGQHLRTGWPRGRGLDGDASQPGNGLAVPSEVPLPPTGVASGCCLCPTWHRILWLLQVAGLTCLHLPFLMGAKRASWGSDTAWCPGPQIGGAVSVSPVLTHSGDGPLRCPSASFQAS